MLDFIIFIGRINYKYYSHEQLNQVMNVKPNLDRIVIGYYRVSSNKTECTRKKGSQMKDLDAMDSMEKMLVQKASLKGGCLTVRIILKKL